MDQSSNVKVKICGIRTVDMAQAAVAAGADFLGFNFVPSSPRFLSVSAARDIIEHLGMNIKIVGVFQDETMEHIQQAINELKLDFVQLHGNEPPAFAELTQDAGVIKSLRLSGSDMVEAVKETMSTYDVDYFLLDRSAQGEGPMVDFMIARSLAQDLPLFLAGGLTPENVSEAVRIVRPYAVDVASGIETDGEPDPDRIRKFVARAKQM